MSTIDRALLGRGLLNSCVPVSVDMRRKEFNPSAGREAGYRQHDLQVDPNLVSPHTCRQRLLSTHPPFVVRNLLVRGSESLCQPAFLIHSPNQLTPLPINSQIAVPNNQIAQPVQTVLPWLDQNQMLQVLLIVRQRCVLCNNLPGAPISLALVASLASKRSRKTPMLWSLI